MQCNKIATEIGNGSLGGSAMLMDAECHERYTSLPTSILALNKQTSRPDLVLTAGFHGDLDLMPRRLRSDPHVTLHLIEVGYTSDFRVHAHVQAKLEQHEQLVANLRRSGWRDVRLHAFIIGHTGVMRQGNVNVLLELGVSPARVGPFLSHLAVTSLLKSTAILSGFPSLPTAQHPVAPTDLPPGGGGSAPMLPATNSTASGERGGQDLSMGHAHASSGERGMAAPLTATAAPGAEGTHQTCGSANDFEPSARAFDVPLRAHASRKRPAPRAISFQGLQRHDNVCEYEHWSSCYAASPCSKAFLPS